MLFTHYLITRFNVRERAWVDVDKNGHPTLDYGWLKHRWELFDKFTLPSVLLQNGTFQWIVLFDKDTKVQTDPCEPFTRLYVSDNYHEELRQFIRQMCTTRWVITTRLDNDDVIAPHFITDIQRAFRPRRVFLDFPVGYRLKDGKLYTHHEECNPFISRIHEPSDKTVLHYEHGRRLLKNHIVIMVSGFHSWMQVIHERNKVTDKTYGQPREPSGWERQYVTTS